MSEDESRDARKREQKKLTDKATETFEAMRPDITGDPDASIASGIAERQDANREAEEALQRHIAPIPEG